MGEVELVDPVTAQLFLPHCDPKWAPPALEPSCKSGSAYLISPKRMTEKVPVPVENSMPDRRPTQQQGTTSGTQLEQSPSSPLTVLAGLSIEAGAAMAGTCGRLTGAIVATGAFQATGCTIAPSRAG